MKKILGICITFCFCTCVQLNAQIDSLDISMFRLRSLAWKHFVNAPANNQLLPIADFTETGLYGQLKEQPLSKKQTPNNVQSYGFRSRGIFTLQNKAKLFGHLDFSRSYTKESSYQLMPNLSEEFSDELVTSPHYPLAIRAGNTENQHYRLMGGYSGVIKKSFPFSITIHYNLEKFFGLTIPKTEQEVIDYSGKFELGYQFKKHHIFGIAEFGKHQTNFSYHSDTIDGIRIDSVTETDYYAGYSVGYGDILGFNASLLDGITQKDKFVFGGGYSYTSGANFFTLIYTYKDQKESYFSTPFIDNANLAAVFNTEESALAISYIKQSKSQYLISDTKLIFGEGTNAHTFDDYIENDPQRTVKTNYKQEVIHVESTIQWGKLRDHRTQIGAQLETHIRQTRTQDINTTDKEVTYWQTKFSINKDLKITPKSFINLETGINYYLPITTSLIYDATNSSTSTGASVIPPRSTFGADVIAFDDTYDSLHKIGPVLGINYQIRMKKKEIATIAAFYSHLIGMGHHIDTITGTNNTFSIHLNLAY
ncbi:DUF6850 family outer membrane beta-barrel protein [Aquimarina pacifica]|uniref:DUF6850 family outer membrane beta-barrel protein n=1 Tax=Aquimarina pacifica TaxID=1296415 RepID=UPI0012684284|nr:DUF6850 family outer membrane beta-barrel protein [Aquimarina pacifica]